MTTNVGQVTVEAVAPSVAGRQSISGRAVATGGILPAILYICYKYILVGYYHWPEMPELETVLPGLAVTVLAWMHNRAQRVRETRDRRFLISLVKAGVVIPIPAGLPVAEPAAPSPPLAGAARP